MMPAGGSSSSNPLDHTANVKRMLNETKDHLREDVLKVADPKAQALFEVTAEVLQGLVKAFEDYEKRSEPAWK